MKEDKLLNDLFESARTEEPKVSYEEVADSFTKAVPATGVLETVRELLLNNISLNSILVVATSGVLLTAGLMMSSPSQAIQNEEVMSQNVIAEEIPFVESSETITIEKPIEAEQVVEVEQIEASSNKIITSNETLVEKPKTVFPKTKKTAKENVSEVTTTPQNKVTTVSPKLQKQPKPTVVIKEENNTPAEVIIEEPSQPESISNNTISNTPTSKKINATNGYNELFTGYGTNLKKLKRNLLNKLISDKFIESKKDDVVIKIEEKQVVINGIKLKPFHYTKYTSIVQDYEIVPEKNRQIRITDEVILVGDFTEKGFRGKGEGHGDQLYLPDFQKDITLGAISIDLSLAPNPKGKVSRDELIMQQILDLSQLNDIFKKDKQGDILPLTLLTNNHFSENIPLDYKGQPITLIRGEASLNFNAGLPIIYMRKYRFGKKKATIKFLYDGYEITVLFKKSNSDWLMNRFQVSGKKENRIDVKF